MTRSSGPYSRGGNFRESSRASAPPAAPAPFPPLPFPRRSAFAAPVYGAGRNEWARISYDFGALLEMERAREGCMPRALASCHSARKRDVRFVATVSECHKANVVQNCAEILREFPLEEDL